MRIQYMREFIAIKEKGNYSKAAKSLYITQPALSRHIADMERELGIRLLDRNKHTVELTETGIKVYKCFHRIVKLYDALSQDIADIKTGMSGTLRLGMLYYTIEQDFGHIIPKFHSQYPNVEFKRYYYQPNEVFDALADDRIDIGVLPYHTTADDGFLRLQNFYRSEMEVMMASGHPLAAKEKITLDDLAEEENIILEKDPITNQSYGEILKQAGYTAQKTLLVDDLDLIPYVLKTTNAVYIKAKGYLSGYGQDIITRSIEGKNLYSAKAYAWRADNPNPLIPLFLELAKERKS